MRELPYPGDELIYRVIGTVNKEGFFASGEQSVNDISCALAVIGKTIGDYKTVLDFGCGCGRIMLWLADLADKCDLHGCDIDERAIAWDQGNIPWGTFKANKGLPPLPYPDDYFDLIFNHSVFTHLDTEYQDAWLAELRRVTKPGGTVLLSVHGEHAFETVFGGNPAVTGDAQILFDRLNQTGIAFMTDDGWMGSALPDYYHTTFHAPWYVFEHWGRYFTIRSYQVGRSQGLQDFILLEKPADGAGPVFRINRQLAAAHAADPVPAAPAPEPVAQLSPANQISEVAAAENLVNAGPRVDSTTGLGTAGRLARKAMYRVIRHYEQHQRQIQGYVTGALRRIEARVVEIDSRTAAPPQQQLLGDGLTLLESHYRMRDALVRVGERITRLELDVFEAIRKQSAELPAGSAAATGSGTTPKAQPDGDGTGKVDPSPKK